MKKILLIHPVSPERFWSLKGICDISGRPSVLPPLGLATLAALTPAHYEVEIIDQSLETIDFDTPCDLVGITGYTVHRERITKIARGFQSRGKLTVGGGAFCSSYPEDAGAIFDVVVVGEAERVWPKFLEEWESGNHQSFYEEKEKIDLELNPSPLPLWDSVSMGKYMTGQVQTSRGCPYDCEFCDVISLFGRKTRHKTVEQVIAEIQQLVDQGMPEIFFADDNFIGNKVYSKALLKALIQLNKSLKVPIRFMTQLTLNVAKDDELLDLLKQANFFSVFIGIETPETESLIAINKRHNLGMEIKESIQKIQSRGILIICGMIVGFDTDDIHIFETQETFVREAGLMFPMVGILTAPKGTKLWDRLKRENRLLPNQDYGDAFLSTNMVPKQMSKHELENNYVRLLHTVYSDKHFRMSFKAFIDQIDVEELKRGSAPKQFFNPLKSSPFYLFYGLRILWTYLSAGPTERKLAWYVLSLSIKKHIFCLPLALSAMTFYQALHEFVERHVLLPEHLGSEKPIAVPPLQKQERKVV